MHPPSSIPSSVGSSVCNTDHAANIARQSMRAAGYFDSINEALRYCSMAEASPLPLAGDERRGKRHFHDWNVSRARGTWVLE
eukprot:scaffold11664_cov38-Cyclotella_meneghiniana.AAC.1